jgi:signal transduction histidine kinase
MVPDVFIIRQITADDLIEIIAIFIIGLVVNFWLESYFVDRKHRQNAYLKLERTQRKLEKMQHNLRFYLRQITLAQEEERQRIAQELHDDTAQDLVVLSRQIDVFISSNNNLTKENITYLENLRQQTNKTLIEVRRFSQDLRPSVLDDLGLLPALEWLIPEFNKHFGLKVEMKVSGKPQRFPAETELILFRIAQESLRNAGKHAAASHAKLSLSFNSARTIMSIKDDGKGFDVPESIGDLATRGKLGLVGMEERVQLINGKLRVRSQLGTGTTIKVEIPGNEGLTRTLD